MYVTLNNIIQNTTKKWQWNVKLPNILLETKSYIRLTSHISNRPVSQNEKQTLIDFKK